FFFSYEGLRWVRGLTSSGTMPTEFERVADFSQTRNQAGQLITIFDPLTTQPDPGNPARFIRSPFPGNVIPVGRIDRVAANILKYFPHANAPGNPFTHANDFVSNYSAPIHKDTISARVDHAVTGNHRVFARFTLNNTPHNRPSIYGPDLRVSAP